jgi:uncharacterized membrane protein YpjA
VERGLRSYLAGDSVGAKALNFLTAFRNVKALALAVTLTNVGGVAYGVVYYWDQLLATPWYLLPFVPDSPAGPFFMILVFLLWWFRDKRRSPLLELLAFCFLLKFGIWTLLMFGLYADYFFTPQEATLSTTLFWLHFGEALEAGILLKGMRLPKPSTAGLVLAWMLLGDACDYLLGTHPRVPESAPEFLVVPFITVALTFICFLLAVGWCRRHASRPAADRAPPAGKGGPGP